MIKEEVQGMKEDDNEDKRRQWMNKRSAKRNKRRGRRNKRRGRMALQMIS